MLESEKREPEQEKQESAVFENLTPEQIEALKNAEIEVLEEYPQVVYCRYKNFIQLLHNRRELVERGIKKPLILVTAKEPDKELPSLNEAIDGIANKNQFREMLEKYPKIKFSRSHISELKRTSEASSLLDEDDAVELCHNTMMGFLGDFDEKMCSGFKFAMINSPQEKNFRDYVLLENIYTTAIDLPEIREAGSGEKYLVNVDELKKRCEKTPIASSIVRRNLERWGGYEGLHQKLLDYRDNFFPGKYVEMADLRDEVNSWLKSFKVPE